MERITATIEYANKIIDAERQDITKPSNASYWEAFLAGAIAQAIEDEAVVKGATKAADDLANELVKIEQQK